MSIPVVWVFVVTLIAFALGFWAHGFWITPPPVPQPAPVELRAAPPLVCDDDRVVCKLHDKAGHWVSTQTRTGGSHPPTIEKPHGRQPATVYRLVGIQNGIGRYEELT